MGSSRVQVKCPTCNTVFLPSLEETQSRAGASARRKGHAFERKVAKQLQEWWNTKRGGDTGKPPCEMKRCPQSGGSVLKTGFRMFGDVVCNASDWKYGVECKNTPGSFAGLHQFLSAPKFKFWDWILQADGDCPNDVISLIVFTRFDQLTFCATHNNAIIKKLDDSNINYFIFYSKIKKLNIYIWSFEDMLASSPEAWKDKHDS